MLAAGAEVAHEHAVLPDLQSVEPRAAVVFHGSTPIVGEKVKVAPRVVRVGLRCRIDRLAVHDERLAARAQIARDRIASTKRKLSGAVYVVLELAVPHVHLSRETVDQHETVVRAVCAAHVQECEVAAGRQHQPFHVRLAARPRTADHLRVHVGVAVGLHVVHEFVRHLLVRVVDEVRAREGVEDRLRDGIVQAHALVFHARAEVTHELADAVRVVLPDLHPVAPRLRLVIRRPIVAGEHVEVPSRVNQIAVESRETDTKAVDLVGDFADVVRRYRRHRLNHLVGLAGLQVLDEVRHDGLRRDDLVRHGEFRLHLVRAPYFPVTISLRIS